jgi:hypothetical protein
MELNKKPIMQERFQHLFEVISTRRFLLNQGIGNEVPFFICPYMPEEAVEMARLQKQLVSKLSQSGILVLDINLYDISIELLKERGIWERVLAMEETVTKDELKELLQGVLDPETYLVQAVTSKMTTCEFDVIFLSGIGEVFPYIRSHSVLNNLQSTVKEKPMVMFFPGVYTHSLESGASLDLFRRLHDDKYYRAFNILNFEV